MNRPDFIDCHAHLNFSAYDEDRVEVLKKTLDENVWMINVGTKESTSLEAVKLAEGNEGVYAIVGLHPIHVNPSFHDKEELGEEARAFTSKGENFDINYYAKLLEQDKVVAIGECGLDYFREQNERNRERQTEAFRRQIELSLKFGKPLMLHVREAYEDVLGIIKNYPGAYGNVHFFAGSIDQAKQFLDLGFTISFTGVITFARQYEELVRYVPTDRILSETDCPYVTPVPHRGKRNEPLFVRHIVEKIARIKKEDLEKVSAQLVNNAVRLFSLQS